MALRNYLYAKHPDPSVTLINKAPGPVPDGGIAKPRFARRRPSGSGHTHIHKKVSTDNECGSGREIVLDDGTKKCANCADCPRKSTKVEAKVQVEPVDTLESQVTHLYLNKEVDYTNAF